MARNVIVIDPELRADQVSLGYTTFLELYRLELVALIHDFYNVEYTTAWNMWTAASAHYSQQMYSLMVHLMTTQNLYISIDRNPSINYGSYVTMKVVKITEDATDYCMGIPSDILTKQNADFDGDIENIICHKIGYIAEKYYRDNNARSNNCVSHDNGRYDPDMGLIKDERMNWGAFNNI